MTTSIRLDVRAIKDWESLNATARRLGLKLKPMTMSIAVKDSSTNKVVFNASSIPSLSIYLKGRVHQVEKQRRRCKNEKSLG